MYIRTHTNKFAQAHAHTYGGEGGRSSQIRSLCRRTRRAAAGATAATATKHITTHHLIWAQQLATIVTHFSHEKQAKEEEQ